MFARFPYVGPESVREAARSSPRGVLIDSKATLDAWRLGNSSRCDDELGWVTYVVSMEGELVVAPRRSEHVACAGGQPVLAAGEMRFGRRGDVLEVSNNSTGYCPAEDCWPAVRTALDVAGVAHPGVFTFVAVFRVCPQCGARNLVKDEWFVCDLCGADLPRFWNFRT